MEPDFERLLQFSSSAMHTTYLTNPVIRVKIEKQGRIMGQKNCQTTCQLIQPPGRLIHLGAAYCQETCLMSEKSRMPRLYILSKIGIS